MKIKAISVWMMAALMITAPSYAKDKAENKPYMSTAEVLAAAPSDAWQRLDQSRLVYLTLNNDKQVVIELNTRFAPEHSAQIQRLAKAGYWDGLSFYRAQDNYVVQFGSFDLEKDAQTRPLPEVAKPLPAEFTLPAKGLPINALPDTEPYSDKVGYVDGFPVAVKGKEAFLVHCYGMVGAGRDNAPDSSDGADLYVMIGQPARNLDRQITLVGRVVHGMEHLSSLPRGSGVMGFYTADEVQMGIKSARMGDSLPVSEQLPLEAIANDTPTFMQLIDARRYLQSEWHVAAPSGGMGVCDVRQSIRIAPSATKKD